MVPIIVAITGAALAVAGPALTLTYRNDAAAWFTIGGIVLLLAVLFGATP